VTRPLFVPITFAMASRIENLPLRAFLVNPTKISNAVRQMRAPLRTDAVTCYFDPLLEAEALGATIDWSAENNPQLRWPPETQPGELPDNLASPEEATKRGRVPIALEVIRRMKTLLPAEILRMAVISGPLTLAARVAQMSERYNVKSTDLPNSALDLATSAITKIAKSFAEAGANLIFLREECTPAPDAATIERWLSALTPIFNIVRFYEATPVLHIAANTLTSPEISMLVQSLVDAWPDCVVSILSTTLQSLSAATRAKIPSERLGINLPIEYFGPSVTNATTFDQILEETIRELRPAIVTTATDLPIATDPKRVAALSEIVRHAS
jgi:uroporphyrinogen-III decarboxylase